MHISIVIYATPASELSVNWCHFSSVRYFLMRNWHWLSTQILSIFCGYFILLNKLNTTCNSRSEYILHLPSFPSLSCSFEFYGKDLLWELTKFLVLFVFSCCGVWQGDGVVVAVSYQQLQWFPAGITWQLHHSWECVLPFRPSIHYYGEVGLPAEVQDPGTLWVSLYGRHAPNPSCALGNSRWTRSGGSDAALSQLQWQNHSSMVSCWASWLYEAPDC